MTAQDMWAAYCQKTGNAPEEYDAWQFGDDPDTLAALVLKGIKTATCSAHALYAIDGEDIPRRGEYSVVLDSTDEAVCIIRTEKVYLTRYCDITPRHAAMEGEGDRSLAYWQAVHKAFFTEELAAYGLAFSEDMMLVCEEFEVVYPQ